ncbi:alpha/beta hydrolase [Paenibacillus flagellatus]|uniref:Acetyl xylan esterase domain-containing protein n=1 Tax=Paenibacillus flagellatus TaxID=2211139 RepID=A0A2V5KC30_9BACL|nr:acetylxylan esterase [Paenibacillus flagellatus]PYI55483.1 hypothetical protein DLM86_07040 [Paenibacillus flagellatus]
MRIEQLERFELGLYDLKDQFKRWVYDRSKAAFDAGDRARDEIRTVGEMDARRKRMRDKLIESVGGLPSSDHPLRPVVTGTTRFDGFRVENVVFESRPSTYVTANLYVPDGLNGPTAAVLFLCGHADEAKAYPRYQSVCRRLTAEGLVVLAVDPIGQGERLSYYDRGGGEPDVGCGTKEHDHAGSQCLPLGDGIARYFIHDAMRAIDYLASRPEVDPARIGVTGNSGGGLQTTLVMVCDPRVAAAAPGTFVMNRESYLYAGQAQDAEQIWRGMTKLGFDHEDLVMAMAPRPVIVLAATSDFFPIEGTRRTVARTRRFWDMYGVPNMPALAEDRSVHQYSPPLADAAAAFFAEHLLGRKDQGRPRVFPEPSPEDAARLSCTASGQVRGDYSDARAVYEENVDRLSELERGRDSLPEGERKRRALEWLNEAVRGSRETTELNPRHLPLAPIEGLAVESNVWWSQRGIFNHGFAFRDEKRAGEELPVSIGLWEGGTRRLRERFDWIRATCAQGRIAFVLDLTADGVCAPHPVNSHPLHNRFGTIHKLTTDLFWLDDSLAAVRAFDLLRAVDMARMLPESCADRVNLYAHGRFGFYAELAAALDARIGALHVEDGPESVAGWVRSRLYDPRDSLGVVLPGMLRYFDLPDLRRWRAE